MTRYDECLDNCGTALGMAGGGAAVLLLGVGWLFVLTSLAIAAFWSWRAWKASTR